MKVHGNLRKPVSYPWNNIGTLLAKHEIKFEVILIAIINDSDQFQRKIKKNQLTRVVVLVGVATIVVGAVLVALLVHASVLHLLALLVGHL